MRYLIVLLLSSSLSCSLWASADPKTQITTLMEDAHALIGFNGSILVAKKDKVLFYDQIGFADKHKIISLKPHHMFNAGSIAKELTTIAVMQMEEQNKLSYSDPVSKYLPNLNSWANSVTIEHIMTHTSGLPRIDWIDNIDTKDVAKQIKDIDVLAFESGKGFLYGNINIVLRALIVEKLTNMKFEDYLQRFIFGPSGMTQSSSPRTMSEHSADFVHKLDPNAIAGMTFFTTSVDLFRFEQALWKGKLVSPLSIKQSLAGDRLSGMRNRAYFDFGRYQVNELGELTSWEHDGSAHPDHHALKFHDFESGISIILMSSDWNKSTLFAMKRYLLRILNGESLGTPDLWKLSYMEQKGQLETALKELETRQTTTNLNEYDVNVLAYHWLNQDKISSALRLFKYNVDTYPTSANTYDSYGEALVKQGNIELAKTILIKGLALSQKNQNIAVTKSLKRQLESLASSVLK